MAFWICAADANGDRLVGTEERLAPGPSQVDYPRDPAGSVVETASGRLIKQQPAQDPRRRAWLWEFLPKGTRFAQYDRLFRRLESLVSRTRREQGLSPYIYLKDTETDGLGSWSYVAGTATGVATGTLTDSTKNLPPNLYTNGVIEIVSGTGVGQRRSIVSHTATAFTVAPEWDTPPTGAEYTVAARVNDWVRVRVLQVASSKTGFGTLRHNQVRFEFVIEDAAFNDLG